MNYIDKNLIIERYTNGSMNAAEMQNFHTMLETDAELRSLLHAENVISSTVNGERAMLESVDHSHTYARFLKSLADSVPQAATATAGAAGANKAASWLAGISASTKITISTLLLAGGITMGIMWLQPGQPAGTDTRQEQPVQQLPSTPVTTPVRPDLSAPAATPVPNTATTPRPTPVRTENAEVSRTPAATPDKTEQQTVGAEKPEIPVFPADGIEVNVQSDGKKK